MFHLNISKDADDFLQLVGENITYAPIRESVKSELYEHILEGKKNYVEAGLDSNEAERKVLTDMGNPEQIAKDFNKVYKRKLDWKMLIIFILLIMTNALLTMTVALEKNNMQYISRNILYIVTGAFISIALYFIDYKKLQKFYIRYRASGNIS